MSMLGHAWRKIYGKLTNKPTNFSWLINKELAGCGLPTSFNEINWIIENGIKSIVTMTENDLPRSWITNIEYMHMPTADRNAPTLDKINSVVNFIHEKIHKKDAVLVHCDAGVGRTGTILACYLIKYKNYSAKNAIKKIRDKRPGSIQSISQETAVTEYEKYIA